MRRPRLCPRRSRRRRRGRACSGRYTNAHSCRTSENDGAVCTRRYQRRPVGAVEKRPRCARAADRGVPDHGRALPAAGLGRQRRHAPGPRGAGLKAGRAAGHPFGGVASSLLPDQQGSVGSVGSQPSVRAGSAAEIRGGELLPRRRDKSRSPEVARRPVGRREGRCHGFLHHDPAWRQRLRRGPLQRRIPGRAGARRGPPARGRAAHEQCDPEALPDHPRGRVPVERLLRE